MTLRHFIVLAIMGLAVAACGRAGPLEPPPSSVATGAQADEAEKPADKPFVLDPLI